MPIASKTPFYELLYDAYPTDYSKVVGTKAKCALSSPSDSDRWVGTKSHRSDNCDMVRIGISCRNTFATVTNVDLVVSADLSTCISFPVRVPFCFIACYPEWHLATARALSPFGVPQCSLLGRSTHERGRILPLQVECVKKAGCSSVGRAHDSGS